MSEKRSYRPGSRRPDLKNKAKKERDGLMSESRWAWVRVAIGQFVILVDEDEDEADHTVRLFHPTPSGRPISWNLTALTEEELLKFKQLIDAAFEWALPIVRRRDKEAADAFAAGDDSHARVYRAIPQLVFRKRPSGEHSTGVQQRPAHVPSGNRGDGSLNGGVRGHGDGLAEHDSSGNGSEDNGPEVDRTPKLR